MGKEASRIFEQKIVPNHKAQGNSTNWVMMESCDHDFEDVTSHDSSSRSIVESSDVQEENSVDSIASYSSSSDLVEDANSANSSFKSSSTISSISLSPPNSTLSNGPLYEISELMVHLPLRRGLSKYYQGKSESFTSLARAKSLEDLPKKVAPYRRRTMKPCKSFNGSFDGHELHCPKAIISKKSTRGSSFLSSRVATFRPCVTIQKNF